MKKVTTIVDLLKGSIEAMPDLLRMEQTPLVLDWIIKQLGIKNGFLIVLEMMRRIGLVGLINTTTNLMNLRLDRVLDEIISNFFISMWDRFEDREAIISEDKRFTYKEYKERVLRLANGLQELGLKDGDTIALMLYNGNEYMESLYAGSFTGIWNLFTSTHLRGRELIDYLRRGNIKGIIFDEEFAERIIPLKDEIKSIEHFIVVGKDAPEGAISYEDLLSKSSDEMPKETKFVVSEKLGTGGTTGVPKIINYNDFLLRPFINLRLRERKEKILESKTDIKETLRYGVMLAAYAYMDAFHHTDKITHNIRLLLPVPMNNALAMTGWMTFFLGSTIVQMRRFDPEEFLKLVEKERISYTIVVPTMLERILALPDEVKRRYDLSSMYSILCDSAPCRPEIKKGINQLFVQQKGRPVYCEFIGSTERAASDPLIPKDYLENPKRYEAVAKIGRMSDMIIFDEEKGEVCPPNKVGVFYTRSMGTIGNKYYGISEEEIRKNYRIINGKEYFREGLYAYLDEDGFLYLTGREKDMIITGGTNIFPDEIEKVILGYPKVADVAVIPIPDKDLGEVAGAIINLKEGKTSSEEEIIEYCKREGLYGYKVPRKVEFQKEKLPRNPEGKMIKREILPKYWEEKGIKRRG